MSSITRAKLKPGQIYRSPYGPMRCGSPVFSALGEMDAGCPCGETWDVLDADVYVATTLTAEDCRWLAEHGCKVKLKTTDVEELQALDPDGHRRLGYHEEYVRGFRKPMVPIVDCAGDLESEDGYSMSTKCFTLVLPGEANTGTAQTGYGSIMTWGGGELKVAKERIASLERERDAACEEVSDLQADIVVLSEAREDADEAAAALHDKLVEAQRQIQDLKAKVPAKPSLLGVMVQDRITGEGPWIVVSEPMDRDSAGGGRKVQIYRGPGDPPSGWAQGYRWAFPEALEVYQPPVPEPEKSLVPDWLSPEVALLGLSATFTALVIPALMYLAVTL